MVMESATKSMISLGNPPSGEIQMVMDSETTLTDGKEMLAHTHMEIRPWIEMGALISMVMVGLMMEMTCHTRLLNGLTLMGTISVKIPMESPLILVPMNGEIHGEIVLDAGTWIRMDNPI